jgi:hypothetical protein
LHVDERALLRQQALDWLRADLTSCRQRLDDATVQPNRTAQPKGTAQPDAWIRQRLQVWRDEPSVDAVRANDSLADLRDQERELWVRFWSDADAPLRRMSVPE